MLGILQFCSWRGRTGEGPETNFFAPFAAMESYIAITEATKCVLYPVIPSFQHMLKKDDGGSTVETYMQGYLVYKLKKW